MVPPATTRRSFLAAAAASSTLPFVDLAALSPAQDVGFAVRKLKPLPYEEIPGLLSKAQLTPHHQAHYGGALKSLVQIEAALEAADRKAANANWSEYRELRREQLLTMNSVLLHELYFDNMAPKPPEPDAALRKAIADRFGSWDKWREDFTACAMACRGWAILAYDQADGRLYDVVSDAHDVGLIWSAVPLLVCDLYEHAYYVDYQNKKAPYVAAFLDHIAWDTVAARLVRARG